MGNQNTADNATSLNAANGSMQSILSALGLSGTLSQDQLNALQTAAGIPYTGVNQYANLINGLTGKYGTNTTNSTQTSTPSLMSSLMQGASLASSLMGGGMGGLGGSAFGGSGLANMGKDALGGLSLPGLNTTPSLGSIFG
jgi:hypothetical protein